MTTARTFLQEEFLKMMMHKFPHRDPKCEILMAFRQFYDDEAGNRSLMHLKRIAMKLGERMESAMLLEVVAIGLYSCKLELKRGS